MGIFFKANRNTFFPENKKGDYGKMVSKLFTEDYCTGKKGNSKNFVR
jgi:hypothetical protein